MPSSCLFGFFMFNFNQRYCKLLKTINAIILVFFISCISSCKREQDERTDHQLKRKLFYHSTAESDPYKILAYHYDLKSRLDKVTQDNFYLETFHYSADNLLNYKNSYIISIDSSRWVLNDSTSYVYVNGLLHIKKILWPLQTDDEIQYRYEYDGLRLVKEFYYYNQIFMKCTFYDYSDNLLIEELQCHDSLKLDTISYTKHDYINGIRNMSEVFLRNGTIIQRINYVFDERNLLILEESIQLDFSIQRSLSYAYRFEYY
jgi:hypothetical protein